MNDKDTIYRQAAIDAVNTALFPKINTAKGRRESVKGIAIRTATKDGKVDTGR